MKRCTLFVLFASVIAISISAHSPARGEGGYSIAGANAYVRARDWNGLLTYATAWTRAAPNDPEAWYYLGSAYGSKLYGLGVQRPSEAVPAYQRAVDLKPQWPEAWYALGMVQQELQDFNASIRDFQHALDLAPTRTNYWNSLAASYSHVHRPDLAKLALANLKKYARTSRDWFMLGNGFYGVGDAYQDILSFQQAERAYQRALQITPRDGKIWTNLGTAEEALGKYTAALSDYQRGAQLGDPKGRDNYARLQGDIASCRQWQQSLINRGIVQRTDYLAYKQHCAKFGG